MKMITIMIKLAINVLGPNTQAMKTCLVIHMMIVIVNLALVFVENIMGNLIGLGKNAMNT